MICANQHKYELCYTCDGQYALSCNELEQSAVDYRSNEMWLA